MCVCVEGRGGHIFALREGVCCMRPWYDNRPVVEDTLGRALRPGRPAQTLFYNGAGTDLMQRAAIDRGNLPRKASSSTNAKPSYLGRICSTRRLAGCCCCCCAPLLVAFPRTAATSPSPSAPPTFMGRSATPPTFTAMRSQRCAHQHTRLQGCCPACELPRLAGTAGRTRGRLMPPPPPAPPRPQM